MMENERNELQIVNGRRKNFVIPVRKIAFSGGPFILILLINACCIWALQKYKKDSALLIPGDHENDHENEIPVYPFDMTWNKVIIFFCAHLLFFSILMLAPRFNVKLLIQRILEDFRDIRRMNKRRRGALFLIFTLMAIMVNYVSSIISLIFVENSLHLRSSEDPTLYLLDERIKYVNHTESPYIIANVTRYNTEDVLMKCEFPILSKTDERASVVLQSLYWTKDNGSRVTETDKIHINTTVRKDSKYKLNSQFLIKSVLTIELIDDGDYGTYSCKFLVNSNMTMIIPPTEESKLDVDHPSLSTYEPPEIQLGELEDQTEMTNSAFHLEKEKMPVKTARVSPGGVFIDHVPYWSLADPGDITFNTTISGKDNADCCWLPARLYKYFSGYENLVWRGKTGNQHQRYLIRQQCVCIEDLVLNNSTVAFVRTRYNSTTKQQERFKVGHPRQVILIPDLPLVFRLQQFMGESLWLRDDYQNCAITNDSSAVCRERFQYIDALFTAMTAVDFFNWFFTLTATIAYLGMTFIVIRCGIRYGFLPLKRSFVDPPPSPEDYTYDLYMMYDEEDRYETKVARTLRQLIEGPTISVFDPWRDILPGHFVPIEQERAIEESRTFCVIVSNSSENNDEQQIELVAIKKTLAARAALDTDDYSVNIFTIKIGHCKVDSFLSPVKSKVPVDHRETNALDEDVLQTFSEWTLASKASWIKMQRGDVHQRLKPYAQIFYMYLAFFICYLGMGLLVFWVGVLDFPYETVKGIRHVSFEEE